MWSAAQQPFLKLINNLKPKVILVLGKELAAHLPPLLAGIEICHIQHPSTGFVYGRWNPLFAEAVKRANKNANS
jgi:uracil-DNA glycosylase